MLIHQTLTFLWDDWKISEQCFWLFWFHRSNSTWPMCQVCFAPGCRMPRLCLHTQHQSASYIGYSSYVSDRYSISQHWQLLFHSPHEKIGNCPTTFPTVNTPVKAYIVNGVLIHLFHATYKTALTPHNVILFEHTEAI